MNYGILMACYIAVGGHNVWIEGRQVKELRAASGYNERILFQPSNGSPVVVDENDCKYLEDPVKGYKRMLNARKIDRIKVGDRAWCLVDEWGRQQCTFDDMAQCLKRMTRLDYCEPNADKAGENK